MLSIHIKIRSIKNLQNEKFAFQIHRRTEMGKKSHL